MLRRAEAYLAAAESPNPLHADAALVLPGHEHIYFFHGRTYNVSPRLPPHIPVNEEGGGGFADIPTAVHPVVSLNLCLW